MLMYPVFVGKMFNTDMLMYEMSESDALHAKKLIHFLLDAMQPTLHLPQTDKFVVLCSNRNISCFMSANGLVG